MKIIILTFLFLVPLKTITLRAGDLASGFEEANRLYEEGKYAAAVGAYDKLLDSGSAAESLYFNRGNALFKMGQIGRAIASYRLAEQISPRDPELRANLQFARTRARGGSPYQTERWRLWLGVLTLNEWTLLTAGSLWTLFVLLALREWRTELNRTLRSCIVAAALVLALSGICLGAALNHDYITKSAIVIAGEADVRNGPLDESQTVFKVRDGMELKVLDQKDDWFQVADPAHRTGWLKGEQVLVFKSLFEK